MEIWKHSGACYALTFRYSRADDAWAAHLSPTEAAEGHRCSEGHTVIGGRQFISALVFVDATREPVVRLVEEREIPFELLGRFVSFVEENSNLELVAVRRQKEVDEEITHGNPVRATMLICETFDYSIREALDAMQHRASELRQEQAEGLGRRSP